MKIFHKNRHKADFLMAWADLLSARLVYEYIGNTPTPKDWLEKKATVRSMLTKEIYLKLRDTKSIIASTAAALSTQRSPIAPATRSEIFDDLRAPSKMTAKLLQPTQIKVPESKKPKRSEATAAIKPQLRKSKRLQNQIKHRRKSHERLLANEQYSRVTRSMAENSKLRVKH